MCARTTRVRTSSDDGASSGGGMRLDNASLTLASNTIRYNAVNSSSNNAFGGGISLWFSDSYISDNVFTNNIAEAWMQACGGAAHFWQAGFTEFNDNVVNSNQVIAEEAKFGAGLVSF